MGSGYGSSIVVFLVLLAGCTGIIGDATRPTVTVTPAEVPGYGPTPVPSDTLGTSETPDRSTEPPSIAADHRAFLENTSFTVAMTRTVRFPRDNRSGRWHLTGRFGPDGQFYVVTQRSGPVFGRSPARIEYWSNGEVVYQAVVTNQSMTVNIVRDDRGNPVSPVSVLPVDPRFEDELARVVDMTHITDLTEVQPAAQVQVTAIGPVNGRAADEFDFVRRVERIVVSIVTNEEGFVRRYDLRYAGDFEGQPVVVTRSVRYQGVGSTVVDRPGWAASAPNTSARDRVGS